MKRTGETHNDRHTQPQTTTAARQTTATGVPAALSPSALPWRWASEPQKGRRPKTLARGHSAVTAADGETPEARARNEPDAGVRAVRRSNSSPEDTFARRRSSQRHEITSLCEIDFRIARGLRRTDVARGLRGSEAHLAAPTAGAHVTEPSTSILGSKLQLIRMVQNLGAQQMCASRRYRC